VTSVEIASYDYNNAAGELVFQSVRYDPKGFSQRRPDGHGGWIYDLDGVRKVVYRLGRVLAADRIFVVEGEKDVHTLEGLGLVGTCNAGGAGNWGPDAEFSEWFHGKHVVILPDQDVPGWQHGNKVARNLAPVAASLKLINLPVATKDLTGWVATGGTREALDALVDGSGMWEPGAGGEERYGKTEPLPDVIEKGQRHGRMVSLAGSMRKRGAGEEAILGALRPENRDKCKPPLSDDKLVKIARSVSTLYEADVAPGGGAILHPVSAAELLNMHFDPYQWAVDNLLPAVGVSILAGRPKKGKSWLALQLGIAVANGTKALGRFTTRQGRVLYLGLEDSPRRMKDRFSLLLTDDKSMVNVDLEYKLPSLNPEGHAVIEACLSAASPPYALLVLDTFVAAVGSGRKGNTDPFREDYSEINMLREMARKHNISILLVHHTRKEIKGDSSEALDQVMGTTGVTAAADSIIVIARRKDVLALVVKGKDTEISDELAIIFNLEDGSGWTVQGNAGAVAITAERRAIVDLLKTSGPLEPREIAERLGKVGATIRSSLARMTQDGLLARSGKAYEVVGHERQLELEEKEF
jgi:hypothetical protein